MKTAHEILTDARQLISEKSRWTHGAPARNEYGGEVLAHAGSACKWCSIGAIVRVASDSAMGANTLATREALTVINNAARDVFDAGAVDVNDRLGHAAALKMFDKAIELAGKKGTV